MSDLAVMSVIGFALLVLGALTWVGERRDRRKMRQTANYWSVLQQRRGWPK